MNTLDRPRSHETRPRPARWHGLVACLPLAIGAALLVGCSDGYPSEDLDQTSPFDMSNTQRVRALNVVAGQAHRRERARFELEALPGSPTTTSVRSRGDSCRLTVHQQRDGKVVLTQQHLLRPSMDAVVAHNEATSSFEVHLVDGPGAKARRLGVLLRSASWTHATQVDLLVQLVIRDCAGREPGSAARAQENGARTRGAL